MRKTVCRGLSLGSGLVLTSRRLSTTLEPPRKQIASNQFEKLDIRVATIVEANEVEGAEKLLKLTLDVGALPRSPSTDQQAPPSAESDTSYRTVLSGIKKVYKPEQLKNKQVLYVANLKPMKTQFGVSEGMILCASDALGQEIFIATADTGAKPGMRVSL